MSNLIKSKSTLAMLGGSPTIEQQIQTFNSISSEEKAAVIQFLDSGHPLSGFYGSAQPKFFGGPTVVEFEDAWRKKFGFEHVVSVNSATSGLIAAMGAIGIGPGDEVIVPPYTMSATAIAPLFYGGIPIFVDIEDEYFCLDVSKLRDAITHKTKAIIAVNLWGHPARLAELRSLADEHGIFLVEDNAQALLADEDECWTGSVGHIGVFSLNVHKHIQTGEGGMCVTASKELADRLKLIRNHGENVVDWLEVDDISNLIGFNFRQSEISAAIGLSQMTKIDYLVDRCRKVGRTLSDGLRDLPGIAVPAVREGCSHSYFMWSLKFDEKVVGCSREAFVSALKAEGFPAAQGYVAPLYNLPLFRKRIAIGKSGYPFNLSDTQYRDGMCPVTERMHTKEIIQYQPVSWDPSEEQVLQMIEAVRKVHRHSSLLAQGKN